MKRRTRALSRPRCPRHRLQDQWKRSLRRPGTIADSGVPDADAAHGGNQDLARPTFGTEGSGASTLTATKRSIATACMVVGTASRDTAVLVAVIATSLLVLSKPHRLSRPATPAPGSGRPRTRRALCGRAEADLRARSSSTIRYARVARAAGRDRVHTEIARRPSNASSSAICSGASMLNASRIDLQPLSSSRCRRKAPACTNV